jgi:hypothetical protein
LAVALTLLFNLPMLYDIILAAVILVLALLVYKKTQR